MNWKTRSRYIADLKTKYRNDKLQLPFPDLSTPANPCTNGFGAAVRKAIPEYTGEALVDTLHKQGMQVLFRSDLPYAGGRKP